MNDYSKIEKLLKSTCKDDILIGVAILTKEFTQAEIYDIFRHDYPTLPYFELNYKEEAFWIDLGEIVLDFSVAIVAYSPYYEMRDIENLIEEYSNEEIKL